MPMKALLVTVNHRGSAATLELLDSLSRLRRFPELQVVVVDNDPQNGSAEIIRARANALENATLLESPTNRGYFGGARWGLESWLAETRTRPDWVIVCNNDVLIRDEAFLEKLFARDPDSAGVLAPRIESLATQLDQNPFLERRPDRKTLARQWFWGRCYPLAFSQQLASRGVRRLRSRARRGKNDCAAGDQQARWIYAPHGAFLIFTRRYFRSGGFLDDGFFLFGEELSVAEICRSLGLGVTYDPTLQVLHNEHQSTGPWLTRFAYDCQREARRYLKERYLGDIA
jgi:GT2 family glycosyltransferase